MKLFHELMIQVWREVSRHVGIEEAGLRINALLERHLPLRAVTIFGFGAERGVLKALVRLPAGSVRARTVSELPLTPAEKDCLSRWAGEGRVVRHAGDENTAPAGPAAILARLVSPREVSWVAGPLVEEGDFTGLVALCGQGLAPFDAEPERIVAALLEPFSVALANDRRLHELEVLREAAEADRLAALKKLGRDRLSGALIGAEGGLKSVMTRVDMVARTDVPVLLLGETGTGKEVIARVIHERSARAGGPFLRVNSGAVPTELLDAELFGHEKGSFTGATAARRGWFERADGGTLLLDEIGELAHPAQVRLLRVLQEGNFERVGGERTVHVDVRLIAATHRDLPAMIQEGAFREDLWYRISAFPVVLPPLRERRQDIPDLARCFAERAARRFGLMPRFPTDDDLAALTEYDWPGNVRELASVIDRAAILGDGRKLEIRRALGVGEESRRPVAGTRATAGIRTAAAGKEAAVGPLADAMRSHIRAALAVSRGRIEGRGGAAARLEINPHTLRARMRKLGIDWAGFRGGPG